MLDRHARTTMLRSIPEDKEEIMAKRCEMCGKGPRYGNNVSHAHNVTKRRWNPNIQRMRVQTARGAKRIRVCTRCLRSGKVQKAV
jgi:large subunit ribosomal protein L28